MAEVWLNGRSPGFPSLKAVLQAAGQTVVELAGYDWSVNSRQSDTQGFPQPGPYGWVYHHTASCLACAANDHRYLCLTHQYRPVSNVCLGMRGGKAVWGLVAAGAANTNGAGPARRTSVGLVPTDQGNHFLGATEISINGIGEVWPRALTDAAIVGHAAILKAYHLLATDLISHHEYAGPRKSDPAGPTEAPLGVSTGNSTPWRMDPLRAAVARAMTPTPPPPPPPPTEDDMAKHYLATDGNLALQASDLITKRWVRDEVEAKALFGADYSQTATKLSREILERIPNVGPVADGWTDHRTAVVPVELAIPDEFALDLTVRRCPA